MTEKNKDKIQSRCSFVEKCAFFNRYGDSLPPRIEKIKIDYCLTDNTFCSRRWVKDVLGFESVPELMMPHQHGWASQLFCDAGMSGLVVERDEALKKAAHA